MRENLNKWMVFLFSLLLHVCDYKLIFLCCHRSFYLMVFWLCHIFSFFFSFHSRKLWISQYSICFTVQWIIENNKLAYHSVELMSLFAWFGITHRKSYIFFFSSMSSYLRSKRVEFVEFEREFICFSHIHNKNAVKVVFSTWNH